MIKVKNNEGTYYINERQFSIIIDTHHVEGDRMVSCTDWRKGNQKEDHLEYCIRNVESVEVTDRIFRKVDESERQTRYMKV